MSETFSSISHQQLIQLSQPIFESLHTTPYNPPESHDFSIKSHLESLLPSQISSPNPNPSPQIRDFTLCCAFLISSSNSTSNYSNWIPEELSKTANSAIRALSEVIYGDSGWKDKKLVIELMGEVLPLLKDRIKESNVDGDEDGDEISAASARVSVGFAVVAACQLRWFITQVERPHLGNMCALVVPCALTALDHWSPQVKEQGMISFIHLAKNVTAKELGSYGDVILDACCHNIVSSDEIWHLAVEMSVLLVTSLQRSNPRSPWYEKMLNEMLGHLERQPRNKERRIAWLKLIEPLFCCLGLVLLAHFRPLFPLFFQWMHADDDETVVLVLKRILAVVKLTWIRSSPYTTRLVDELAVLYKEVAMRTAREEIRACICQILVLLQQCKGPQFEATWEKYKDDPNLEPLAQSVSQNVTTVVQ